MHLSTFLTKRRRGGSLVDYAIVASLFAQAG